jgi:hypothetical protein
MEFEDIVKKIEEDNIPHKRETKLATIYVINGDQVETKEEMCDVITIEGKGYIPIKY